MLAQHAHKVAVLRNVGGRLLAPRRAERILTRFQRIELGNGRTHAAVVLRRGPEDLERHGAERGDRAARAPAALAELLHGIGAERRGEVDVGLALALHKLHRALYGLRARGRRVVGKRGPDKLCVFGARDGGHREVFWLSARSFGPEGWARIPAHSAVPGPVPLRCVFFSDRHRPPANRLAIAPAC